MPFFNPGQNTGCQRALDAPLHNFVTAEPLKRQYLREVDSYHSM